MASNLKVGGINAYQPYREVEPVSSYPRIDPHQPRDQYPQQESLTQNEPTDQARRRFRAMRKLIDRLKENSRIVRVDYLTAEQELCEFGRHLVEEELVQQLLTLKFPLESIEAIFKDLGLQLEHPDLQTGGTLSEVDNFFPVYVAGLSQGLLCFNNLPVPELLISDHITNEIRSDGQFVMEKNRIRLEFRDPPAPGGKDRHRLNIRLLVAITEMDEEGRRAFLYQRADLDFALYADKQISLSI